jgi:hypothetical protein
MLRADPVNPAEGFVGGGVFDPRRPVFPQDNMTTSLWILYNLERNAHFHRPYQYGLFKRHIIFTPEIVFGRWSGQREEL